MILQGTHESAGAILAAPITDHGSDRVVCPGQPLHILGGLELLAGLHLQLRPIHQRAELPVLQPTVIHGVREPVLALQLVHARRQTPGGLQHREVERDEAQQAVVAATEEAHALYPAHVVDVLPIEEILEGHRSLQLGARMPNLQQRRVLSSREAPVGQRTHAHQTRITYILCPGILLQGASVLGTPDLQPTTMTTLFVLPPHLTKEAPVRQNARSGLARDHGIRRKGRCGERARGL
mmetsp:Transcript_63108/g.193053  ORF Transcript_63108/g.193053 Transcript_63108/m.193053 type:complete len:237 (+) Transcript_63108:1184-1894(+)